MTTWVKYHQAHEGSGAWLRGELPLELRMWLLALDRMGSGGHATFERGELRGCLGKPTGERYSAQWLNHCRQTLMAASQLAPSSTLNCLLVPMEVADRDVNIGRAKKCPVHGNNDLWSLRYGGGWVPNVARTIRDSGGRFARRSVTRPALDATVLGGQRAGFS